MFLFDSNTSFAIDKACYITPVDMHGKFMKINPLLTLYQYWGDKYYITHIAKITKETGVPQTPVLTITP